MITSQPNHIKGNVVHHLKFQYQDVKHGMPSGKY